MGSSVLEEKDVALRLHWQASQKSGCLVGRPIRRNWGLLLHPWLGGAVVSRRPAQVLSEEDVGGGERHQQRPAGQAPDGSGWRGPRGQEVLRALTEAHAPPSYI